MNTIDKYLKQNKDTLVYLFDMDGVLTLPTKKVTPYEREMMMLYIKIMSLRKKVKTFKKAYKILKINDDTIDEIIKIWLSVNSVNPTIYNTLKQLKRSSHKLAIATNNANIITYAFVKHNKLKDYFQKIFTPENLQFSRKPEEKYFRLIEQEMRTDISSMTLIDDSIENINGIKKIGGNGILYQSSLNA